MPMLLIDNNLRGDAPMVLVHGDDFMVLGDGEALRRLNDILKTAYELKWLGTLGDEVSDDKEVHCLNRLIRCGVHQGSSAIFLEPDRRHVDLLVQQLGMASAKGVETPDVKKSVDVQMMQQPTSFEGHGIHAPVVCYASSIFESGQA